MIKLRWVVCYIYNGETQAERFESKTIAEIRMMQLESCGMKPTLHERNKLDYEN